MEFLVEEVPPVMCPDALRYRFTVSDTGVGMSEEFLMHIFDPFARSDGTERIEGTGLGLSITKGLVDLMGGEICVDSPPGKGSRFQVELEFQHADMDSDAVGADRKVSEAGEADARIFVGMHFLVAEDNEINAEILCELLAMYGAETVVKEDGRQVFRAFRDAGAKPAGGCFGASEAPANPCPPNFAAESLMAVPFNLLIRSFCSS